MGAEDFAFMLEEVPGCYGWLGNGPAAGGRVLHGPKYEFNDDALESGIRYWVALAEAAVKADDIDTESLATGSNSPQRVAAT